MVKKRRTRKDKINPKHNLTVSWNPAVSEAKNPVSEANVKGHLPNKNSNKSTPNGIKNIAISSDKNDTFASIKKELTKSLIFALLIIASEVVIYLVWQ